MMPGLHDVNVKMAIMDKLMSFFMICYFFDVVTEKRRSLMVYEMFVWLHGFV